MRVAEGRALRAELADTRGRLAALLRLARRAAGATAPRLRGPRRDGDGDGDGDAAAAGLAAATRPEAEGGGGDAAQMLSAWQELADGIEARYACGEGRMEELLMRGRQVDALLDGAMQQLRALKHDAASAAAPAAAVAAAAAAAAARPPATGPTAAAAAAAPQVSAVAPAMPSHPQALRSMGRPAA
ncbi:hypothetical protein MNEG_10942 [Monoraphidium neglectum]|uniref:Uncharacterized protein n=1 Tax=Monoraphidium neglectum TaxID=145388 RepID=A0A0D2KMU6_9CHLO|nr:hypothetical protein MNEG_10942 [Monoraphidium neglectum]KIY97018.1 hypothetical protein MNEG_10942 [Monoraphidium neglectum]|eukprot:XP_013896038.1 hypothetical protein MNEG_10942 [Monoraphidium neglectum]